MAIFPGSAIPSAVSDYEIDNSLRFDDGDNAYLSRTPTSAGNRKTWTLSVWIKRGNLDIHGKILNAYVDANNETGFYTNSGDTLAFTHADSSSLVVNLETTPLYRDPASWYHLVLAVDTEQGTASNRAKLYVNGSQVTAFATETYPAEDLEMDVNSTVAHYIGRRGDGATDYDGYLAEFYLIDGTQYAASDFGELDSTTNQWKPIDASGLTFGTNGFYQKYGANELANSFTDSSAGERTTAPHVVTPNGNVHTDTSVKKFGTASAQFDGSGDYLTVPSSADWDFWDSDFTMECWVRFNNVSANQAIWYQGAGSAPELNVQFEFGDGDGPSMYQRNTSSPVGFDQGSNTGWSADTWYHFALVRSGSSYVMYRDGTSIATLTDATTVMESIDNVGVIGTIYQYGSYQANPFNGYIDEYRISNTARYTTSFTPSTSAFTPDANTLLLLHMDGVNDGTVFRDQGRHTITAVNDVTNTRAVKKIGDSSIYFDGSDYLTVPDSRDFDYTSSFTIEFWFNTKDGSGAQAYYVKRGSEIATNIRMGVGSNANKLEVLISSGTSSWDILLAQDIAAISDDTWYHLALTWNGSVYTVWLDGASVTTATSSTYPTVNTDVITLGGGQGGGGNMLDGYLDEIRISDTARYTTTFTPQTTAFTTDSNTLLLIHSNWDGGLGLDSSGEGNNFTPTNLVATDQMVDTPTNNWCTYNPLVPKKGTDASTFSEGNLKVVSGVDSYNNIFGTMATNATGKWYAEFLILDANARQAVGATSDVNATMSEATGNNMYSLSGSRDFMYSGQNGNFFTNGAGVSYGDAFSNGDIIAIAINLDDNEVNFYRNNVAQGVKSIIASSGGYVIGLSNISSGANMTVAANFGQDSSFAGQKTAQGNQDANELGDFYYAPPTGFLSVCTDNLSAPEIALPGENFNTVIWTGDDADDREITGVGFQPDLTWNKRRSTTGSHQLQDALRGVTKVLKSNSNTDEATETNSTKSFDSDGFTVGTDSNINGSGITYVAWNWKAGGVPTATNSAGAGATPTAGSVKIDGSNLGSALAGSNPAKKISANTAAGFSIVSYEGNIDPYGTQTIAHGLSEAPELIIIKNLDDSGEGWPVGATLMNASWEYVAWLEATTQPYDTGSGMWNDTAPTSSVWTVKDAQASAWFEKDYIAYCFHSVEGYSKVGKYTGNGEANATVNGPFAYCGFRPAWVLIKSLGHVEDWFIYDNKRDTYNVTENILIANTSAAETTDSEDVIDFLSNGFKAVGTGAGLNHTVDYIYLAFAESPFKYSNAR